MRSSSSDVIVMVVLLGDAIPLALGLFVFVCLFVNNK